MAPIAEAHHHRSTTKASHKSFKSKHSTKGFLKESSKGARAFILNLNVMLTFQ